MIIDTELKYKPKSLSEFIFADSELEEAILSYTSGSVTRPLILSGEPGTGKTLLAHLLPSAIEGFPAMVNKVKAEDLNSAKAVLAEYNTTKAFNDVFKVNNQRFNYKIIEEVNSAGKASNAFRVALDESRGMDLTIMTSNNPMKIDAAVRSRCEIVEVQACAPEVFLPRAKSIMNSEGCNIDDAILMLMLKKVYQPPYGNREYYKLLDKLLRKF